jgi:hypothetical protein
MSRESSIQVDGSAGTVAGLRAWTVMKPILQESVDVLSGRFGMAPAEILAHQIDPCLEQIERRLERLGDQPWCGWH